ncbi:hypothetical protein F5884DRAFT_763438 [Xylogone sp. PMI_703]|nr:hypothetical protein F5884DRAFT_763438 [Xylogone sp. PMI_703]
MTENLNGMLEILVHASAPSRNQDDEKYRALAKSYLDFRPARRVSLSEDLPSFVATKGKGKEKAVEREPVGSFEEGISGSSLTEPSSPVRLGHHIQNTGAPVDVSRNLQQDMPPGDGRSPSRSFQAVFSPSISFSDVIDNADSPEIRRRARHIQEINKSPLAGEAQDSWEAPPSVINDSQPHTSQLDPSYSAPINVLELYLQTLDSVQQTPLGSFSESKAGEAQQTAAISEKSYSIGSQLNGRGGTSIYVVNEKGLSIRDEVLGTPTSSSHTSLASAGRIVASTGQTNQSGSFTYKYVNKSANNESLETTDLSNPPKRRKTDDILTSSFDVLKNAGQYILTQFANDVLEVHPPGPAASRRNLTPDELISKSLHKLSEKMSMAALFKPKSQVRPLRPMERGYWSVNCQTWDDALQQRTWKCLCSFIGKGEAGWGVWSVRDAEFEDLRVYCWGVVVGHIYLLLYMASEGKIRNTGASWIGGDGRALIVMPP